MSRELCKVLRAALRSWSATLRLCLIALAIGTAIALSSGAGPASQRDVMGNEGGRQEASSHRERETTRCGRENLRAIRATTRFRDRTAPARSGLSGQQKVPPPAGYGFESSHRPDRIRGRRTRRGELWMPIHQVKRARLDLSLGWPFSVRRDWRYVR